MKEGRKNGGNRDGSWDVDENEDEHGHEDRVGYGNGSGNGDKNIEGGGWGKRVLG